MTALFFLFSTTEEEDHPGRDDDTTFVVDTFFWTMMMMMMMDERIPCVRLLLLAVAILCAFLPEENVVLATASANTNYNGEDKNNEQLWCEPDNCYDVLEVHQHNATKATIKKQYFKFSRMYHPDKIGVNAAAMASEEEGKKKKKGNDDDDDDDDERKEMTAKFAKLARAYEILSDERRRRDYDYALKYPEDKERNRAMFYRDKYSNQGILRARFTYIFIGIAIVVTLFQFFNDRSVYRNVWLDFKASDVYAREMKTRLKKVNEKRMMANVVGNAGKKKGSSNGGLKGAGGSSSSISSMNREDSSSSLNATTGGNNKAYASKREKKKFLRNRSKEEEERDILDIEDEMRAQLVEQGVLSTPTWRNLAIVIVSKWAVKKAREIGAKAKAKARDIAREAKKKK